jgi:DNA mismatch endonuclease (patch repair protein)
MKFRENVARDARNEAELRALGWNVIVVWECELRDSATGRLERLVQQILSGAVPSAPSDENTSFPETRRIANS